MRGWWQSGEDAGQKRRHEELYSTGSELDRKYWMALALYAILAVLVWFTMDAGTVLVMGRPVQMRLIPLVVIGGLALRTVLARHADKIRHSGEDGGSSASRS